MHIGLEIHNACLRKCIADNHGYEVKTVGDSFVVAFHNVVDAAAFMLRAQYALLQQPWSEALLKLPNCEEQFIDKTVYDKGALLWRGLRVRMGCHVGEVDREYVDITGRVDYFGPPVNMAARVESMAHGGEILISEACYELLRNVYPESMSCVGIRIRTSVFLAFFLFGVRLYFCNTRVLQAQLPVST